MIRKYLALTLVCYLASTIAPVTQAQPDLPTRRTGFGGRVGGEVNWPTPREIDYTTINALMQGEKWEDALKLLRSYTVDDDLYFTDWNDIPHHERSAQRRFLIAQCLVHLGRKEEARQELRSVYEVNLKPNYGIQGMHEVATLLIELETGTEQGYINFREWMNTYIPRSKELPYRTSVQQVIDVKHDVESGHFESGWEELSLMRPNGQYQPQQGWQQEAIFSYFKKSAKARDYLLQKLAKEEGPYPNQSLIYYAGELGQPEAISTLRKLRATVRNYNLSNSILYALFKCNDKETLRPMYALCQFTSIPRVPDIIAHLNEMTGLHLKEVKSNEDSQHVLEEWKAWLDKNMPTEPLKNAV